MVVVAVDRAAVAADQAGAGAEAPAAVVADLAVRAALVADRATAAVVVAIVAGATRARKKSSAASSKSTL